MKAYCLSGLGADKRAFDNFRPTGLELIHVDWHKPGNNETLEEYASAVAKKLDTDKPFALIGLSFGGMVAVEIAKMFKPEKLFVISSLLTKSELPVRFLSMPRIMPIQVLTLSNFVTHYFFGVTTRIDKALLNQILKETDPLFLKWGINAMVNWKNTQKPECVRIHGTRDRILPGHLTDIKHKVRGGGHFMIVNKAEEITKIVEQELVRPEPKG